jgi:DNA-binding NarL/FixJ family response regulator
MSIKILLADDSDIMRAAIVRLLNEESGLELVGEATSFAEAMKMTAALKPSVLLLDLYMRDNHECPPPIVKSYVGQHGACVLAISLSNDEKARALAESFGAKALLDKASLFSELLPAIKRFCSEGPKRQPRGRKRLKSPSQASAPSQAETAA